MSRSRSRSNIERAPVRKNSSENVNKELIRGEKVLVCFGIQSYQSGKHQQITTTIGRKKKKIMDSHMQSQQAIQ